MGCIVTFKYKSKNFEEIEWYSEKIDKRLKNVYIIKSSNSSNFIAKEISQKYKNLLINQKKNYSKAFLKTPEFFLKILGFEESIKIIDCSEKRTKKNEKQNFVKIEIFEKSLFDDINVRALKNRIYNTFEIWNLIYFSIFVFSILEENNLQIGKIDIFNFLIKKKKFLYFCPNLFFLTKEVDYNQNFIFLQFKQKIQEFIFIIFSIINNIYNFKERQDLKNLNSQQLIDFFLRESQLKTDYKLFRFLKEILVGNIFKFKSFVELRSYCIEIFKAFEVKFFDKKYIEMFR